MDRRRRQGWQGAPKLDVSAVPIFAEILEDSWRATGHSSTLEQEEADSRISEEPLSVASR